MTEAKFMRLWDEIIKPAIQEYLEKQMDYKLTCGICEKNQSYKDTLIPRMVWATKEASRQYEGDTAPSLREMRVATNANMLANIFYFLELHSAS